MGIQLSATDLSDLRCSYVSEKLAATKRSEERATVKWLQQWFDGRLSVRQPTLNILDYTDEHFGKSKVSEADFVKCSQIYTDWAARQIVETTPRK